MREHCSLMIGIRKGTLYISAVKSNLEKIGFKANNNMTLEK